MAKIEFILEGLNQTFDYIEKEKNYIDIGDILSILQKNEIQKNEVVFIKYLNTEYNAWELIKDNEKLQIGKEEGLQLLIETKSKNELMEKMYIIDKKIDEIVNNEIEKNNKMKEESSNLNIPYIKSSSSLSISENPESEMTIDNYFLNSNVNNLDIVVLTGNPLVDKYDGDIKELKTMNDFNFVTYSIHKVILDCNKQIVAKFLPLTFKNFKDAILLKPKILHLICKSTYLSNSNDNIINENENFSPYLLFENEKCEMERINGESFKNLIEIVETKGGIGLLKDISLIISTPLAQDIFEMIKQYSFKNIIVQHTVYSNVAFIAEINEQFYNNIIELDKSIEESFKNSKNDIAKSFDISKNDGDQSCCCFHSHSNNCKLKSNLYNELYNENKKQNLKEYYLIPHFFHLRYKCICNQADFCKHNKSSCDNYQNSFKFLITNSKKIIICCCDFKNLKHDLENIFFEKLSEEKEAYGFFSNNQNNNNNFSIIDKNEFVPSYYGMDLIVGRNKIIYNIFELLMDNNVEIINIHGPKNVESINKIDTFIDIIIKFLKERIPYLISDSNINIDNDSCYFLPEKQNSSIILTLNKFNYSDTQINDMKRAESAPLSLGTNIYIPTFEKIDIREDFSENIENIINNNRTNDNNKKIYFINAFNINKENLKNELKKIEFSKKQVIVFTNYILGKINGKKIKYIELKNLTKIDYTIKLQRHKILYNKIDYDNNVKNKINENNIIDENFNDDTIYKDNEKANLNFEILFLFNCSNSGHFKMEMEKLYSDNLDEIEQILDKIYVPKNIIEKKEIGEKVSTNIKYYLQYKRSPDFNNYYKSRKNNIPEEVKQRVLQKLFQFYAMVFRLIIKKAKNNPYNLTKRNMRLKLKKKYKPLDSLTTFSAIQELGIWESFEKISQNDNLDIYNIVGYFQHLLRNFVSLFKNENIILCYKIKEIWEKVSNDIEDISITLPTCLKMFSIEHDLGSISLLKEELKHLERYSHSSLARLELFEYIFEYNENKQNHNYDINIEKLNDIEKKFSKYKCKKGILETLFAKCIVKNWKYEDYKEINKKLKTFKNDKSLKKNGFIILFKNKINYLYYKHKIKCGKLTKSNEDLSKLKEMLKDFKNENKIFYVIKVCFLFSELYKCQEEKDKYIEYLNFAYYISNIYQKYLEYTTRDVIEEKKKMKDNKKPSKDMNDKMEILCNEYGFDFKENLVKNYYYIE